MFNKNFKKILNNTAFAGSGTFNQENTLIFTDGSSEEKVEKGFSYLSHLVKDVNINTSMIYYPEDDTYRGIFLACCSNSEQISVNTYEPKDVITGLTCNAIDMVKSDINGITIRTNITNDSNKDVIVGSIYLVARIRTVYTNGYKGHYDALLGKAIIDSEPVTLKPNQSKTFEYHIDF